MVPPPSHRIPRVRWYSGYRSPSSRFTYRTLTFSGWPSHAIPLRFNVLYAIHTPGVLLRAVWSLPLSLAATRRISFDFSSSGYLDVSVPRVPHVRLFYSPYVHRLFACVVSQFGYPRIIAYLQLPAAFRSLSRPSSAPDAKAFSLCSF